MNEIKGRCSRFATQTEIDGSKVEANSLASFVQLIELGSFVFVALFGDAQSIKSNSKSFR